MRQQKKLKAQLNRPLPHTAGRPKPTKRYLPSRRHLWVGNCRWPSAGGVSAKGQEAALRRSDPTRQVSAIIGHRPTTTNVPLSAGARCQPPQLPVGAYEIIQSQISCLRPASVRKRCTSKVIN